MSTNPFNELTRADLTEQRNYEATLNYDPLNGGPKFLMQTPDGFQVSNTLDLAQQRVANPEWVDTVSLGSRQNISSTDNRGSQHLAGSQMSAYVTTEAYSGSARIYNSYLAGLGLNPEVADRYSSGVFSESNRMREVNDLRGSWGVTPGTQRGGGFDVSFGESLGMGAMSRLDVLKEMDRESDKPGYANDAGLVEMAVQMGYVDQARADAQKPEDILESLDSETVLSENDVRRLDETKYAEYTEEANKRQLQGFARQAYVHARATHDLTRLATAVVNKQENPELLARAFDRSAQILGPDVVAETMMLVSQRDYSPEAAWAKLPKDVQKGLEFLGKGPSDFLKDRPDINNDFTYANAANNLLMKQAGEMTREVALADGMHDGWATWTRRLSDTIRTDIADDPTGLYFMLPTLFAGGAAGLLSKVPTSLGRMALGGAADGVMTMIPEGAVMSQIEQLGSFYSGSSSVTIDDNATLQDSLLYGAMGSIGGAGFAAALVGGPRLFGQSLRGASYTARFVEHQAAKMGASGAFGETAQTMARNALAIHEASSIDREAVSLVAGRLNEGVALRLRSGEIQALDVAREIIPKITRKEGDLSSDLEALLSPEALGKANVSALEVSEAMAGIAKRLGPDAEISETMVGNILAEYIKQANRASRLGDVDPRIGRIQLLDNAFKAGAQREIAGFMTTGEGATLTDDAFGKLVTRVKKLISGKKYKGKQLEKILRETLRISNEETFDAMVSSIRKTLGRNPDQAETLTTFNKMVDEVKARSVEARKDPQLQKALRVRAALSAIDNEATIKMAKGLGISPSALMRYVDDYARLVGQAEELKRLRESNPAAAEAIERMNEDLHLAFEFSEAANSHFNFRTFEQSGAMDDIIEMEKFRSQIHSGKKLKDKEQAKQFRKLSKKLGVNLSQEQAYERVANLPTKDKAFRELNDVQKGEVLERGILRLDGADDGSVSPGSMTRDLNYADTIFRETALGAKIEKMLSRVALWPQVQRKLFRNNNRIIRGIAQLITGQHITTRSYSSAGTVLSFESAVEGARREAMPYVAAMLNHRRLLGREVSTIFDQELQFLRMRGAFTRGEIDVNALPPELRRAYAELGGDEQLVKDLSKFNDELTDIFTRTIDEAKEAGIFVPKLDPRTYLPNRISGGLGEEEITRFVADFKALRSKQMLAPGAALSADVLDSLGWIRFTSGSELNDLGRRSLKSFEVPEDSPFAGMVPRGEDPEKWVRANIIKKGTAGLRLLEEDLGRSAPSARNQVSNLLDKPADLLAIKNGQEVLGRTPDMPMPESAASNAVTSAAARAMGNVDEEIGILTRARSNMALLTSAEQATEEFQQEAARIDRAISTRQTYLNSLAISRFSNDQEPAMPRVEIPLDRQRELVLDDSMYSTLSAGHGSLVSRLDEMLALGMIDENAKRITMAAFVDVDPSKLAGMSFVRLDQSSGIRLKGLASVPDDVSGSIVRLADIDQSDALVPGHEIAETIAHETGHIAFLSASPRLQRTFQALYEQTRGGGNDIADLFEQFDIPLDRALANVHEFVAYLAQISLVSNRLVVKSPATKTLFQKMRAFFLKLIDNVYFAKPKTQRAASMLDIGEFDAIERGIKDVFGKLNDDATVDNLLKKFDIVPADRVDEFGEAMPSLRETFDGRKVKKAEAQLAKLSPELDSLKARATDPENPLTEADEKKLMQLSQDVEEQQAILAKQEELFNAMADESPAPKPESADSSAIVEPPVETPRKKYKSTVERMAEEEAADKEAKAARKASLASIKDAAAEKEAKSVASVIDGVTIDAEATAMDNFNLIFTALSEAYSNNTTMLNRLGGAYDLSSGRMMELLEDGNLDEALSVFKASIRNINQSQLDHGNQRGRKAKGKTTSTTTEEGATVDVPTAAREEETFANALNETEDELGDMISILSTKSFASDEEYQDIVQRVKQLAFRQWVLQDQARTGRVVADGKGTYVMRRGVGGWKAISQELADHVNAAFKQAGVKDRLSKSFFENRINAKVGAGFEELGEEVKVARQAYREAAEREVAPVVKDIADREADEAMMADPVVQREVAATSVGEVDYPFPGYTLLTTEELIAKIDGAESVYTFMADGVQQAQKGEGSSYSRELAALYHARRGSEVEAPAPKDTVNPKLRAKVTVDADKLDANVTAAEARIGDIETEAKYVSSSDIKHQVPDDGSINSIKALTDEQLDKAIKQAEDAPLIDGREPDGDSIFPVYVNAGHGVSNGKYTSNTRSVVVSLDELRAERASRGPKPEVEAADSWPPAGSLAATDPNASAPYALKRIQDDSVDRAYMFYNQDGEPVFVSHTVAEETLPNGRTERVMYVDFESTTADGEVTSFVNTGSGDPLQVIRTAFSKAEADAEELGVNTVFITRGDVDGDNVQGVKIYKRLVEQAYPDKTVYSARANRGNPYLAVTLDNTNPLTPSLGSPFPFDQSYYLLTDTRLRSILKKTDWPIDLKLKGKDLRKAVDSYLQENHTKLGDDIPTWDNSRPAPKPEVEAPAPKPEAEAGGGIPPKDPPKTAKGAGAAGEEPTPEQTLADYLKTKPKKADKPRGKINGSHRLADRGDSLDNLYRTAVLGTDSSVYSPEYKALLKKQGFNPDTPVLDVIGRRYVTHASGGFKTDLTGSYQDRSQMIGAVSNPRFERVFDDADLQDDDFGKELARRFAQTSSSELTVANYASHTLGSVRVQKMINDLFQTKGLLVQDLFDGIKQALEHQAERSINNGAAGRTANKNAGKDINDYMRDLQTLYLRARGISPDPTTALEPMKRASRITRNLTYSLLGGKFGMSVGFVEMPLAVLRSSGLNPVKMIQNTGIILNSWLESAQKGTSTFKPTQDYLSSMGINKHMANHSLEDLIFELETLQASTLSRFQSTETEVLTEEMMINAGERLKYHAKQVTGSVQGNEEWATKIANLAETSTAAAADITGMGSFMTPLTKGIRAVARNQAQETILRHHDGLVALAKRVAAAPEGRMTTEQIQGAARELGVPRRVAIYAAQSGLLAKNGELLEGLMRYLPAGTKTGKQCSAGRVINFNDIQRQVSETGQARKASVLGEEFDAAGKEAQSVDEAILPALNQYFLFTIGEYSPELRGAMKISGAHPLMDLMYQLLTYPMAAYQALAANGITARGTTMTAGILTGLMGLEYFNRNAQRSMFAKDEETRQESRDKLGRLMTAQPSLDDVVEVIALYGTSSPLFGAFGSYARDLVGAPTLRATGHSERPFAKQPFVSPAMSTAGRVVGQGMRFLGGIGTGIRENDFSQMRTAGSKLLSTGIDGLTPANGVIPATISQMMFDAPLADKLATLDIAREAGSEKFHPAYTYPVMEDNSYLKAYNVANSPQSLGMVTPATAAQTAKQAVQTLPSEPVPAPGQLTSAAPSSGLADLLKKRK
jgi:hypothetical protein